MKSTWKILSALILVIIVVACTTTIDPTPQYAKSVTTFSVTTSSASVAVAASDSLSTALNVNWNDPKFSVGLSNTQFVVVVGVTGNSFKSFVTKSFSGVLTGALTGKDVNGMAVKLGGAIGQPISLDLKVVASQSNNDEYKESNTVQISVTPFSDLGLNATKTTVVCTSATATANGDTLSWNTGFAGYSGVITYQLQYAKGGTNFASPTSVSVSSLSKIFTVRELNLLAQAVGIAAATTGNVDFRVKATNEAGNILYSNTVTVAITTYVAYNSIGIIGDFTGWANDVDLYRPDPINAPGAWTVTLHITSGGVKFRANDGWNDNWGDSTFPSGTGQPGGANIPISTSGYYTVNFNAITDAYSFSLLTVTDFTASGISVIGDATPGGWGTDTPLTQSSTDPNVWTGTVAMTSGGAFKFRKTGDWGTNWGLGFSSPEGHSGWGVGNGGNIPVTASATYFVYFNSATSEFFFGDATNNPSAGIPYNSISIIGDGTPGGWGADTNLIQNPANPYEWSAKVALTAGSAKFRKTNDWGTNWGSNTFPNGIGTQGGANIPVNAGAAQVTFNSATGEYTFTY